MSNFDIVAFRNMDAAAQLATVRTIMETNDRWVERAMLTLLARQTSQERASEATLEHNGRGFSSYAARPGTYYANWVKSGKNLTGKHLATARRIAIRHARQIVEEILSKPD